MSKPPLIDISPENWNIVHEILQRYIPDHDVWAFGSRAQWLAKEFSDLDLAVIGQKPMDISLIAAMDDAFKNSALPFKVDLVDWANITPSFQDVIKTTKVEIQRPQQVQTNIMAEHVVLTGKKVPEGWQEVTLESVSDNVSYGYTASATDKKIGPHFLRITDIQDGFVNWDIVPYCKITPKEKIKYCLNIGDIVVARTGNSTGENYIITKNTDAVFASYLVRFQADIGKAFPKFIWYTMRSQKWWSYVESAKIGSAQPGANAKILGRFSLLLPRLPEQRAIAHILGTLDDRIQLLRQTNATLEAMAQAIFKSWFVDFDPVRAKAEGREPDGVPTEALPLFPDELVPSELGMIPKGWRIGNLNKVARP